MSQTSKIDSAKLTPYPWSSVAVMDPVTCEPTGKSVLAHGDTLIAIFENEADCDLAMVACNWFRSGEKTYGQNLHRQFPVQPMGEGDVTP